MRPSAMPRFLVVLVMAVEMSRAQGESMCQTDSYRGLPIEVQNEHQCMVLEHLQKDMQIFKSQSDIHFNEILSRINKLEQNLRRSMISRTRQRNINDGTGFPALKGVPVARDCNEIRMAGIKLSGIYPVKIPSGLVLNVYCDMDTGQGGWTLIQRRHDGIENFTRAWDDYAFGFGNVNNEFWLGNENIHSLTQDTNYTLRVDLWDWEGGQAYAAYSNFRVGGEDTDYRLQVSGYRGTAGDSLSYHNNMRFTTPDRDHDLWWANCGLKDQSGWWFNACSYSSLNGVYHRVSNSSTPRLPSPDGIQTGIQWYNWKSDPNYSLKRVELKIKPKGAVTNLAATKVQPSEESKTAPVYG